MDRAKTLTVIILGLLLSAGIRADAGEEEPCAPFLNGKVEQSRVDSMRAAAKGGHLYVSSLIPRGWASAWTVSLRESRPSSRLSRAG